jgi:predicted kinase
MRNDRSGHPTHPAPPEVPTVPDPNPVLTVPDPAVVVLVGPAGCGKSTFAAAHFSPAEVLSSDAFRSLVAGDAADQGATSAAFALLRHALDERAKRRRSTVVDATNLTRRERRRFVGVARRHQLPCVAVVLDLPSQICRERAAARMDRIVTEDVVLRQRETLHRQLAAIEDEGFDQVTILTDPERIDQLEVTRVLAGGPATTPVVTRAAPHVASDHPEDAATAGDGPDGATAGSQLRPPAVIVDLDGTLTSAAWREHHLTGRRKDWPSFFAGMGRDAPVGPLVDLVGWVANHAAVVLLTGRPADHEPVIRRWLADHAVTYDLLLMRRDGDRRPDTVVKRERYLHDIRPRYDVRLAIDDRPGVIEMWRDAGVYVLTAVDPRLEPLPGEQAT